jgi:hypothetical protein
MKTRRKELSYNEVKNLLASKYNNYQNADINGSNFNNLETEFSEELNENLKEYNTSKQK